MRMYDIIMKKRNGKELAREEIEFFVDGYTRGEIPDYQMSAMLMAIYFSKLNERETYDLTMAMANSGDMLDLSAIGGVKVDKHSTGGVGDKTSLVIGPMVAALGVPMAKMSGRGLGHTGGTVDKLESIPGFSADLPEEQFVNNVNRIKMALAGQTANLAPADKKIYALRDVTATVDNMSLIASSIMSKKLASGADAIVLDVKTGSGAFMEKENDAVELARMMVKIGESAGRKMAAFVTNMDEPLGYAVGNALEIKEVIRTLKGEGPKDLIELSAALGAYMIVLAGHAQDMQSAAEMVVKTIEDGSALKKFGEFVEAQGGNGDIIYDEGILPSAPVCIEAKTCERGFVAGINTKKIGMASLELGGGRETKESSINPAVGVVLKKKVGDKVEEGECIAEIYADNMDTGLVAEQMVRTAFEISKTPVDKQKLIKWIILSNGVEKY